ncbi:CFEM domain-containing protein isoform 3 [Cladophialophora immunda]|nr:CFEM domain-containing protein isoform 2 [Cladophialophora immunda]OQV07607.1 CFEM domain-containing protein isoform 3 [Cladophialophora immunda]
MRFLALAAVGLSSFLHLAASQDLSTLPTCAVSCALNAISSTGCATTDAACICQASSFLSGVYSCISTACNATDIAATLQFAETFCGQAGVSITLPTASATAGPTFTPSSTSAPASASATLTSSYVPASGAPAATYTGGAQILKQQWAGVAGVVGLGVAAIL